MKLFAAAVLFAACAKSGPKSDTLPGRQLGESTASPGANASKPQPVTPDDPRVMNVSAGITPAQARAAAQAPLPPTQNAPAAPTAPAAAPAATADTTVRAPAAPDPATSSTPVTQPTDIAPPSTTAPTTPQPNVFSPPPPPPQ